MTHQQPSNITWHMTPSELWTEQLSRSDFTADSLAPEGFIHCTNGDDELIAVGNRYYQSDPRDYVGLAVDLDKLESPWRFDSSGIFPHIYGPINKESVIGLAILIRSPQGAFLGVGPIKPLNTK